MSLSSHDTAGSPRRRAWILAQVGAHVGGWLVPGCAAAQPQLRLEVDMNVFGASNPFLLPGDVDITFGGEIVARPEVKVPLGPGTTLDANGALALRQYHRRYGNFVTGQTTAALRHRRNEFLTLESTANFARTLPTEALADTAEAALDSISIRESWGVRQAARWTPNALTTITGDAGWERTKVLGSPLLAPTSVFDAGFAARRRTGPATTIGAQARLLSSRAGETDRTSTITFQLTATRQLGPRWRAEAAVGLERSTLLDTDGMQRNTAPRFSGNATLCHEPEHIVACVTAALRSVASGLGGFQRETAVGATLSARTSEHGRITASADYRRSRLLPLAVSAEVLRLSGGYTHRLRGDLSMRAGVDYLRRTSIAGPAVGAVIAQIGITYRGFGR